MNENVTELGHWILTNVCITQADILASASSTTAWAGASPLRRNAPLPMPFYIPQLRQIAQPHSSSTQEHLISELLCTLSRLAASRQISWLSLHPYLLYH
jgi:hypothetical protein